MISFPNAKINLGLQVVSRREDGYHDLETVFYPLPFYDALEIVGDSGFSFESSGINCGEARYNLCVKAYRLLEKDFPRLPKIRMHLHKAIPAGAGLGGGSADGAFALKMMNEQFSLRLDERSLREYALQLGSDCPFFIINKPSFASGRGEILTEMPVSLKGYQLLLVLPGIHIATKSIFQQIKITRKEISVTDAITQPVENWKDILKNDFEDLVFKTHPELRTIKKQLIDAGAVYASMTGTGSSIYGLFKEKVALPAAGFQKFKWLEL